MQFSCKGCGYRSTFNTSARLGIPNDGKVRPFDININFEVLSNYCRSCDLMEDRLKSKPVALRTWILKHKPKCENKYDGSSPMMEVVTAERIWALSLDHGFRYITLISDDDSKKLSHLNSASPYGEQAIDKIEYFNHVAKRLGTALRKVVQDNKNTGCTLGGKTHGSLKNTTITKLTAYYRNAIQNNVGNLDSMKKAVFATPMHCETTNATPKHQNCPEGKESWCFFQKALANNATPFPHATAIKTPLRDDVVSKIMQIYKRLGSEKLLSRSVDGKAQNANEVHGVLWSKCPKTFSFQKYSITKIQ